MNIQENQAANILIVDDVIANLIILTEIIKKAGYVARPVTSVRQAMEAIDAMLPHLILLDITMPEMDGFEYCDLLKRDVRTRDVPVIFISAMNAPDSKVKGFSLGAVDFIVKPFEEQEVYLRVNTHLRNYQMQQELEKYNRHLQRMVNEQVRKIAEEQKIVIYALARYVAGRHPEINRHINNNGANARMLSLSLQFSPKFTKLISNEFVEAIELAAPLNDIGKSTIPNHILNKPVRLSDEEMEIMKTHSKAGADFLYEIYSKNENNIFLKMAAEIALFHHERWDGTGYPAGLQGNDIPLHARITAVIDTYDALTGVRCYKEAYSHERAMEIINEESGTHFDPEIIAILNKVQRQLKR